MAHKHSRVAVIDYQMGNLYSVSRACEHVGLEPVITADPSVIAAAGGAILPGVGAFGDAMENLRRLDLVSPIRDFVAGGKPFMGICLGLQLLMSESEEFGSHRGLDIVPGRVLKFPVISPDGGRPIKVPQVGWNRIYPAPGRDAGSWQQSLLRDVAINEFMYFVHSFYTVPKHAPVALSYTFYEGTEYCSSIATDNIFACQFHPEKSGVEGMKIYHAFAERVRTGKGANG